MSGEPDNQQARRTVGDRLLEFAETVPVHVGRFVNSTFRLVLGGTAVERSLRQMQPTVDAISALEPELMKLSDTALSAKTEEFKNRLADGEPLDDLLVESFAAVREVARRLEGHPYPKRHFDVQMIGGIVLHEGKIAEMITGEGKTLVATLSAYLNALTGRGVHIVTVNDYLARRDSAWMGPIYEFLGLSCGAIQSEMDPDIRKPIYACDIVYGTNSEFGFDYLRDNMKIRAEDQVQREQYYAIIDEVDSVLIDEARTPLIISGMPEGTTEKYYVANRAAQHLRKGPHYEVKEKEHTAILTEEGILTAQKLVGVPSFYAGANVEWPHYIDNALKAKELYRLDHEYVVREGEVIIVDEFTGRLMPGRRWSDGLHQAIEAKEGLRVQEENQTLATITIQNFFRMYKKLSGMTGTALTEAAEFAKIYDLEVVPIPPNKPLNRVGHPDVIYATDGEKVTAIIDEIAETHAQGRPALVGTISVERSEMLSDLLKRRGIKHVVLNAKYHKKESAVIAQAGEPGAVTIATNMAGRGTDIVLGGNPTLELQAELEVQPWNKSETEAKDLINVFRNAQRLAVKPPDGPTPIILPGLHAGESAVWDPALPPGENVHRIAAAMRIEVSPEDAVKLLDRLNELEDKARAAHEAVVGLGGLHIVGTERHEARRIDNQLRGRAGRQGDPGTSRFFLSLEDDLMRIFMGEWVRRFMRKAGLRDGQPIESGMVSRAIERAQKKVEEQNFNIRKHLLEYDEVMNEQRKLVYGERQAALEAFRERPPEDIARELVAEFIAAEWLLGDGIELRRSFQPAHAAARAAADVDVTEDAWRRLGFREFCEQAARSADCRVPPDNEVAAAAARAVAEAIGEFEHPRRWFPDEQQARARALGFELPAPWPAEFADRLVEKLAQAVEPAATEDLVRDWVRRGLDADLVLLPAVRWDYDAYQKWIGSLPCEIGGAEWAPLLARPEKIEPLIVERLTEGIARATTRAIITDLVRASVSLYVGSAVFLSRPSMARLSVWADYRLGIRVGHEEIEELADAAAARIAEAAAAAKARELDGAESVALRWHYPAISAAVRATLGGAGRDFIGLAQRLEDEFRAIVDPFELSKLHGGPLHQLVAGAIAASDAPKVHCAGLDEIVSRTFTSVIDRAVGDYLDPELTAEDRGFEPLRRWADSLGLLFSREQWLAVSRRELPAIFVNQARQLGETEAADFARRCVGLSVEHFLASDSFAEDRSYSRLAAWARGRFSFAAAPVKLETALPRKVDARRNEAKQNFIDGVQKAVQAEGAEPTQAIDRLVGWALRAYFITSVTSEEIDLENLARWVTSKLHISAPASRMEELPDLDEAGIVRLVCERARQAFGRQKPERLTADLMNVTLDCFLPAETFPDTWRVAELEEWLKSCGLGEHLDVHRLVDDARADLVAVLVDAALAGYGDRPPSAVAADVVRGAVEAFLEVDLAAPGRSASGLAERMSRKFNLGLDPFELAKLSAADAGGLIERLAFEALERRTGELGRHVFHWVERVLILQAIDTRWRDHLAVMDSLKSGIGLRAYAQVDPKIAYKKEGYEAFEAMIAAIHEEVSDMLLKVHIDLGTEVHEEQRGVQLVHGSVSAYQAGMEQAIASSQKSEGGPRPVRAEKVPSRNDPCPCGSGKKYKNCCMGKA